MKDKCEYRCEQVLKFFPARLSEEWTSDCCLMLSQLWQEQATFFSMRWWCPFCTSQTPLVGFFSASSLKQQIVGRHVTPFRHIILIETTRLCSSVCKYNLEIMSHLWHWSQNSHNCFQSYLSAFSRSISSFLNLWIFQNNSSIIYWYDHVNIIHVRSC
jgi:hypothetical protein